MTAGARIDLGDGHWAELREFEGEIAAADVSCNCPSPMFIPFAGRSWARGFNGRIEAWDVVSDNPLTLSPSLLCRACGDHGYIRNGRWERA